MSHSDLTPASMNGMLILVNYNQELEIERVLDRVALDYKIADTVIVDDGSSDRSPQMARDRGFHVIAHPKNRGVGAGIRTGIDHARASGRYQYVIIMASNGKMHSSDIPALTAPILKEGADYVQGNRFLQSGGSIALTPFRRVAIPVFAFLVSVLLGKRFTDVSCGFRSYRLSLFDNPKMNIWQPWLDKYELEYYIHYWACRLGYKVAEAPVRMDYSKLRKDRKSKIIPFIGWWSMIRPFLYLSLGFRK
jgi:dolichol-phosphate mannosyltransferase